MARGDDLYSTAAAAAAVGVGSPTFLKYADAAGVEPVVVGKSYLWTQQDVDRVVEWLEQGDDEEDE